MSKFYSLTFILLSCFCAVAQVNSGISMSPSVACTAKRVIFTASVAATPTTFEWSIFPTKDVITTGSTGPVFTAIFPKDLTYTVTLKYRITEEEVTIRRMVPVSRSARATFNASLTNAGYPNQLILTNYSSYSFSNFWRFSDVSTVDSLRNTSKFYPSSGNYSVTLFSLGSRGCNDTTSYSFRIADSSALTIPNVFSPNRDDVNDVLKPITVGISSLNGYIYTREGILLYHWDTVYGYWDGRNTSGELCVAGQYIIIVEARGFDGKIYNKKGHVTLIR